MYRLYIKTNPNEVQIIRANVTSVQPESFRTLRRAFDAKKLSLEGQVCIPEKQN